MRWRMPGRAIKATASTFPSLRTRQSFIPLLRDAVTETVVQELFAHRRPTAVKRYLLPKLAAMNFVLDGVLDGGVTQALNLDFHGKTLSFHLLGLKIAVRDDLTQFARSHGVTMTGAKKQE